RVLRVQHEDVIADLEGSVRRMLDYCGLPFEQACVDFHKTERRVHTASSEQVRRPINREGVDQWRNFEPWLGPLGERLGPRAERGGAVAGAAARSAGAAGRRRRIADSGSQLVLKALLPAARARALSFAAARVHA